MRLHNEETGLKIVPQTFGMSVPSACTIVIIAGKYTRGSSNSLSQIKNKPYNLCMK